MQKKKLRVVLKNLAPHYPYLAIIVVLAVFSPLTFFRDSLPQMSMDTWIPLHPYERMRMWSSVWDSFNNMLGQDTASRIPLLVPYVLTWVIGELAGLTLATTQKLIYIQIFLTAGLSMYYLGLVMFRSERLMAFIAALVFMFNPISLGYWESFFVESIYGFSSIPLTLGLFVRGIQTGRILRYAILAAAATLLFPAVNPPTYLLMYVLLFSFGIYAAIENKIALRKLMTYAVAFMVFVLLFNLWWITGAISALTGETALYMKYSWIEQRLQMSTVRASLLNNLRLFGNNNWGFSYWADEVNNRIGYLYDTNLFLMLFSLLYPILAFGALLRRRFQEKSAFLAIIALVFMFLSKGTLAPYGSLYAWLYDKAPGFSIYRTPSDKMCVPVLIAYALLIGISVDGIRTWLAARQRTFANAVTVAITVALLGYVWPYFTGDAVDQGDAAMPAVSFDLPDYYKDAAGWMRSQNDDGRMMSFPGANVPTRWSYYDWGFLGAYAVQSDIFGRPVIDKNPLDEGTTFRQAAYAAAGDIRDLEQEYVNVPYPAAITQLLQIMGVKYVVLHEDVIPDHMHFGTVSPRALRLAIKQQEGVSSIGRFGKLEFFKVADPAPRIYSSPNLTLLVGDEAASVVRASDARLLGTRPVFVNASEINLDELIGLAGEVRRGVFIDADKSDMEVDTAAGTVAGMMTTAGLKISIPKTAIYELWLPRIVIEDYAGSQVLLTTEGSQPRAFTVPKRRVKKLGKWQLLGQAKLAQGEYLLSRGRFKDAGLLIKTKVIAKSARVSAGRRLAASPISRLANTSYLISDLNLRNSEVSVDTRNKSSWQADALVGPVNRYVPAGVSSTQTRIRPLGIDNYQGFGDATVKKAETINVDPLTLAIGAGKTAQILKPIMARDLKESGRLTVELTDAAKDIDISVIYELDKNGDGQIDGHFTIIRKQPTEMHMTRTVKVSDADTWHWVKAVAIAIHNKSKNTKAVTIKSLELAPGSSPISYAKALTEAKSGRYSEFESDRVLLADQQPEQKYLFDVVIDNGYLLKDADRISVSLADSAGTVHAQPEFDLIMTDLNGQEVKALVTASVNQPGNIQNKVTLDLSSFSGHVLRELTVTDSRGRKWRYAIDKMTIEKVVDVLQSDAMDSRGVKVDLNDESYLIKRRQDIKGDVWDLGKISSSSLIKIKAEATDKAKIRALMLNSTNAAATEIIRRIKWRRIDQSKYIVDIAGGPPTWLVFNEAFSAKWRISRYSDGQPEAVDCPHIKVNAFANAWRINDRRPSRYQLEYLPQRALKRGAVISMFSLLSALIYVLGESLVQRRRAS